MQKAPVSQVFFTILRSKNNWEKNSRKWKAGKRNGKLPKIFDSRFNELRDLLNAGHEGRCEDAGHQIQRPTKAQTPSQKSPHAHTPANQTSRCQHPGIWFYKSRSDRWFGWHRGGPFGRSSGCP